MRKAVLFVLLCRCLPAQQSGIEGVVIDSATHQPIAGVHITLQARSPGDMQPDTYGAISQRDGHFSVTGMPPAAYFVLAGRNGYIYLPGKAPGATVKPGEITSLALEMTPQAAISGHVLDENGDPVQHVQVSAVRTVAGSSESRLRMGMNTQTDERGQFRMTGAPGKYLLRATPQRGLMGPFPDDEDPGGSAYGDTYFPATGSKTQATAVTVTAGREATGMDIRLTRNRTFTIAGTITGTATPPASPPNIWIFSRSDGSDRFNGTTESNAGPDGKFAFHGLSAGHYRLMARTEEVVTSPALQSQFVDVALGNADATNLILTLAPGESLSGILETEGAKAKDASPAIPTVRLEPYPEGPSGHPKGGEVGRDGAFRFDDVFPGEYRVQVVPLPENAYLKSVNLDGVEMANATLQLSRGAAGAKLSVKVSLNGGQLQGRILDKDGQPLPTLALVALAASADEIGWEHLKPVQPGDGFTLSGLRPGKYRLLAISAETMPEPDENEALRAMFPKGMEIEIHEGDRIIRDIQPIAAEGSDAKR